MRRQVDLVRNSTADMQAATRMTPPRRRFLTAALALACAPAARAGPPVLDPDAVDADLDLVGRFTAPVHLNGQGPFRFIVDTGANRSALSRALAERLALPSAGEGLVHAFTGVFAAPLARVDSLRSGALAMENLNLPLIAPHMLARADGLLGVDGMSDRRLVFDFRVDQIRIEHATRPLRGGGWGAIQAERRFGNLIVADGEVGRIPVRMIVDTGANQSFANTALRDALRTRGARVQAVTGTRILAAGAAPIVLDEAIFIPRIEFDGMDLRNVVAYVDDLYIFRLWNLADVPALVLGMDLITQVRGLAIDYARGSIHFRGRSLSPLRVTPSPLGEL